MADVEVAEQPQAENQMLLGGDAAMTAEPAQHIDLEANVDDAGDDVAMGEAPVHHEEQGDAPAPGDGIFDGKNDSAEAPLGFDEYDDGEGGEGGEGDMDTYDANDMMQIDLDNADVEELERQKQLLLEEKKKLIEQLRASGYSADMPAFAQLEAEVQEAEAEAAAAAAASGPGKKRGRPRKSGRGGDLSASGDSYGDASKRKRGRPPKKRAKHDDSAAFESDLPYYQPEPARAPEPVAYTQPKIKYTASAPAETADAKRPRAQWSLAETRTLLRLLETGYHDADSIWDQLSQQPGHRKSLEIVRNKRIHMAQKAAARGVSIIELVREDIAKMEASGIPAESGLMEDEPLVLDPNISVHDVPVEPPGFHGTGKRRGGRAKRTEAATPATAVPAATSTKATTRPSIRFTPAAEPTTTDMRNIVAELRQAQDMNRQIMLHHTQMMEVMFRELQRVKSMNRQLMQHAGLSFDSIVDEELPINPLAGSSLSQSSTIAAPPNSLASSYTIDIASHSHGVELNAALDQSAHVEMQPADAAHSHVDVDTNVDPDAMETTSTPADVEMKDETTTHNEVAPVHTETAPKQEESVPVTVTPAPAEPVQSEATPAPEAKEDGTDDEADEAPAEPQL